MARDLGLPPDPPSLLISFMQQHVDVPLWDTTSDASPGVNSPAPSGLSSESAYTNTSDQGVLREVDEIVYSMFFTDVDF